ncbi:MAG: hypothetical protein V1647_05480 [Pseudomonadota bacterium]
MTDRIGLITPGCLSGCWGGKYHYFEPFIGCAHDCVYCYAKHRTDVQDELTRRNKPFNEPSLFIKDKEKFMRLIKKEITTNNVKTLKLSRYTDIFTPPFSTNGISLEILKALIDTQVERFIITTKGIPGDDIVDLICDNANRFSFNTVARPCTGVKFEYTPADLDTKLNTARKMKERGVLTTVHLDPLIPGLDDDPDVLDAYLSKLSEYGLKRIMFSYLYLHRDMLSALRKLDCELFSVSSLLEKYDKDSVQLVPNQKETSYMQVKHEIKMKSIKLVANLLNARGFEFVICGLKSNVFEVSDLAGSNCKVCNGSFYA